MKHYTIFNITYRITYALFYAISLLPWKVLYLISDMVRPIVQRYYRRDIVRQQLRESFPDKSIAELAEIERLFYRHLCDIFVEVIKQCSMSRSDMMQHLTFSGHEEMMADSNAHDPVVLVLSTIAIAIASINIFGGFLVTHRMLKMFERSSE